MSVWTYEVTTGRLYQGGLIVAEGYSGRAGKWRNNPAWEAAVASGPIPAGRYKLGRYYTSKKVGPYAIPLLPVDHNARGRSALLVHGDSRTRDASRGCVILPRDVRIDMARKAEWTPAFLDVVHVMSDAVEA